MPQSWVTITTTIFGFALIGYGLVTHELPFKDALETFLLVGYGLGLGRKLDRVHESNERIHEAVKGEDESLDELIERGRK